MHVNPQKIVLDKYRRKIRDNKDKNLKYFLIPAYIASQQSRGAIFAIERKLQKEMLGDDGLIYDGNTLIQYNFISGDLKRYWKRIIKQLRVFGIETDEDIFELIEQNTLIPKSYIAEFLLGVRPISANMFFYLINGIGVDLDGILRQPFYTYLIEGDRLIIKRNIFPRITINAKINDWYDIRFDLALRHEITHVEFTRYVIKMTDWYFINSVGADSITKNQLKEEILTLIENGVPLTDVSLIQKADLLKHFDDMEHSRKKRKGQSPYEYKKMLRFIKGKFYNGELPLGKYYHKMQELKPKRY